MSARHTDSRGDILLVLPDGLTVVDISVVHPCASTYVRAARVAGGAALVRDDAKRAKYETADPTATHSSRYPTSLSDEWARRRWSC